MTYDATIVLHDISLYPLQVLNYVIVSSVKEHPKYSVLRMQNANNFQQVLYAATNNNTTAWCLNMEDSRDTQCLHILLLNCKVPEMEGDFPNQVPFHGILSWLASTQSFLSR
jgi:hypothetical protein